MVFCLNPAKPIPFPHNPTSPDLPGLIWITSHQLSTQAISVQNAFECLVASARGSCPLSKDLPSAAEPPELSSNTNPDPEQVAMQQSLIHKEEWIEALECELFALRRPGKKFDGIQVPRAAYQLATNTPKATPPTSDTSATSSSSGLTADPATKPVDKGKASECTVANEQPPIAKEPIARPPIHPFSGIPGHYVPPANRNFAAPD
ncbi:hypothetical protein E4T56_gene3515 [Termitomyces sp. T112]|nr:hypothetical protein E4T56_gene3515 [Termitomyces sp. T112]